MRGLDNCQPPTDSHSSRHSPYRVECGTPAVLVEESRQHKKLADIEIERQVQALDKKVCANESQRDIARYDLRDSAYYHLLAAIVRKESQLAAAKIELQFLRDEFEVAKITYET